jgi:uncharacterized Zn finger protein
MARQSYGVTPWGMWFIDVLDSYEMDARLGRGKTYANTGKVLSLEVNGRKAIAKVKGNYRPSYKVEIEFPPLEEQEKEEVLRLIERMPPLPPRLLQASCRKPFYRSSSATV